MSSPYRAPPLVEPMPPARLYLSLHGRIDRRCFWLRGVLALFAASTVLMLLLRIAGFSAEQTDIWVNMALAWPLLAVSVKRWHDRDRSGWWALLSVAPPGLMLLVSWLAPHSNMLHMVATLVGLVCWLWAVVETGFLRGTPGPNRFGEPLADD